MEQVGTKAGTFRTDLVARLVVFRHLLRHTRRHILHIPLRRKLRGSIIIEDRYHLHEGSR